MATTQLVRYNTGADIIQPYDAPCEIDEIDWLQAVREAGDIEWARPVIGWAPYTHLVATTQAWHNADGVENTCHSYELTTFDPTTL